MIVFCISDSGAIGCRIRFEINYCIESRDGELGEKIFGVTAGEEEDMDRGRETEERKKVVI